MAPLTDNLTAPLATQGHARKEGMMVGVETLRSRNPDPSCVVYVSGFRIVEDNGEHLETFAPTRHCEYRVVVLLEDGAHECWQRFSSFKAMVRNNSELASSPSAKAAWESVRRCRPPLAGVLDSDHLTRKCLALETFLRYLAGITSPERLVDMLIRSSPNVPNARRRGCKSGGRPWAGAPKRFGSASPVWMLARGIYGS